VGFEPTLSGSRDHGYSPRCPADFQAFQRPESFQERPAGVEPALPPWHGSRLPLHQGRVESQIELSMNKQSWRGGNRTLDLVLIRDRLLPLSYAPPRKPKLSLAEVGPKGVEPLPSRLKGGSAAGYATTPVLEWTYEFEPNHALHRCLRLRVPKSLTPSPLLQQLVWESNPSLCLERAESSNR
jgi:hypothetical protein